MCYMNVYEATGQWRLNLIYSSLSQTSIAWSPPLLLVPELFQRDGSAFSLSCGPNDRQSLNLRSVATENVGEYSAPAGETRVEFLEGQIPERYSKSKYNLTDSYLNSNVSIIKYGRSVELCGFRYVCLKFPAHYYASL
ncbi:hypothetical protein AOQ84DRAFT_118667 [Glonium stellatum]|uniref:Uncharacterized protein n=1 Tax=Glonium stellatum TaxID=574774 RepID=A0A8E2FDV0_9PEZI|nr:hypothetical protein AOQ84DRAFT_118667 [Glonium stellatum]